VMIPGPMTARNSRVRPLHRFQNFMRAFHNKDIAKTDVSNNESSTLRRLQKVRQDALG